MTSPVEPDGSDGRSRRGQDRARTSSLPHHSVRHDTSARRARRFVGLAVLFGTPSLIWSLIFKAPVVITDPFLFIPLETAFPGRFRVLVRLLWVMLSTFGLLLAWSIYPEAYGFYLHIAVQAIGSPQGMAMIVALFLVIPFIFARNQEPVFYRSKVLSLSMLAFALVAALKFTNVARDPFAFLKSPSLRSISYIVNNPSILYSFHKNSDRMMHAPLLAYLAGRTPPQKILVVVLEAWGEMAESLARIRQVIESSSSTVTESGFVAYQGSTLAGEVRVLCGRSLNYSDPSRSIARCLPRTLSASGYDTVSLHGNSGVFYYRYLLYPQMGFARRRFLDDLPNTDLCTGAFLGPCDSAVLDEALREIGAPGRKFVYVMSLTGHIPVDTAMLSKPYVKAVPRSLRGDAAQTINRAAILYALEKASELPDGLLIYFVGDHNPAGSEGSSRVVTGRVPYLIVQKPAGKSKTALGRETT